MPAHHIDLDSYQENQALEGASYWTLTAVLLATVETEITKFAVHSQWRKIVNTLSQKYLITTEIRVLEWGQISHSCMGTVYCILDLS
jgi:hypothetical protein